MKRNLVLVCLCVITLIAAQTAFGAVQGFKITNKTGVSVDDLHLVFSGAGGAGVATLTVFKNAPGCNAPIVLMPANYTWDFAWDFACVDNNEYIIVKIISDVRVAYTSGYWTLGGVNKGAADVAEVWPIPALSTWGLVALVVLLLVAGTLFIVRRRVSQRAA